MIPSNVPLLDVVVEFDNQCKIVCEQKAMGIGVSAEDLFQFIKNHERRPIVLRKLSMEIQAFERKFRQRGPEWLRANRANIANATAKLFVEMAKLHKDAILGQKPTDTQSLNDQRVDELCKEMGLVEDTQRQDVLN